MRDHRFHHNHLLIAYSHGISPPGDPGKRQAIAAPAIYAPGGNPTGQDSQLSDTGSSKPASRRSRARLESCKRWSRAVAGSLTAP
jgi:hypothetical protein